MKKIALILSLICVLLFSGCGSNVVLQFDPKWGGSVIGYTETLTYDVTYQSDYSFGEYEFIKNDTLPNLNISAKGNYVVTNQVLSLTNENLPDFVKNNTLVSGMPYVIKTTSALLVNISYELNGEVCSAQDTFFSEAYYRSYAFAKSPESKKENEDNDGQAKAARSAELDTYRA